MRFATDGNPGQRADSVSTVFPPFPPRGRAVGRPPLLLEPHSGNETVMSPSVYRQVSFAAPGASVGEAGQALDDILVRHRRGRLLADRTSAERDLAHDMTDENSVRLLGMVREQVRGG